ncbi:MAG: hypothetical protein IPL64_17255 [Flavobacteriales bacterium]|nr:hypothetical protein [Flavobacteriales bacterium]
MRDISREWHLDGRRKYVDQRKDGTWNYYGDDGKLPQGGALPGNTLHGSRFILYPDGTVAEREERVGGELQGQQRVGSTMAY